MNYRMLKSKMALRGISQRELAKLMNLSENTLSNKISGKSRIYIDEAEAMCRLLGVESIAEKSDIFFGNDIPKRG